MRLYTLITKIINLISLTYTKIKKLDTYWSTSYTLTTTYTQTASSSYWSMQAPTAAIDNNFLVVTVHWTRTGSQVSSGTSLKAKIGTITITGIADLIPASVIPCEMNSMNQGGGPAVTTTIVNWNRVDNDTLTADFYVGATAAGPLNKNQALVSRFFCPVARELPLSS